MIGGLRSRDPAFVNNRDHTLVVQLDTMYMPMHHMQSPSDAGIGHQPTTIEPARTLSVAIHAALR